MRKMAVELPGFKTVFPNEVYSKDNGDHIILMPQITSDLETTITEITQILVPIRFTKPTEARVVEYIQGRVKTQNLEVPGIGGNHRQANQSDDDLQGKIDLLVRGLPDKVKDDIRAGDLSCIGFIKKHTSAPSEEEQYILLRYGLIPTDVISSHQQAQEIQNANWYHNALSHRGLRANGYGQGWQLQVLLDNGALPDREMIANSMRYCTLRTEVIPLGLARNIPREVNYVLDAIYQGINSQESISQIPDFTVKLNLLEEAVMEPLMALHIMVRQQIEERPKSSDLLGLRNRLKL